MNAAAVTTRAQSRMKNSKTHFRPALDLILYLLTSTGRWYDARRLSSLLIRLTPATGLNFIWGKRTALMSWDVCRIPRLLTIETDSCDK